MPKSKNKTVQIRNSTAEFLVFAYQSKSDGIEVRVQDGTVWLGQKLMAALFDCSTDNISLHLKNIFKEGELNEQSVTEDFSVTASDWEKRLNMFLETAERSVLQDAGKISAEIAKQHAETEFELFRPIQDKLYQSDFDKHYLTLENSVIK